MVAVIVVRMAQRVPIACDHSTEHARYNLVMRSATRSLVVASFVVGLASLAATQAERTFKWKVHDMDRPQPARVDAGPANPVARAPSDAIVLFDAMKPDLSK